MLPISQSPYVAPRDRVNSRGPQNQRPQQAPLEPQDRVELGFDPGPVKLSPPLNWRQSPPAPPSFPQPADIQNKPGDGAPATQIKQEYRQAWDESEKAWQTANRAAQQGPGTRRLPDGSLQQVSSQDGRTDVITRNPNGTSQSVRFDPSGRVYVQNRGADGKLQNSLYRDDNRVMRNTTEDSRDTGLPEVTYRVKDGQATKMEWDSASQPGDRHVKTSSVQPDGTVKDNDAKLPANQGLAEANNEIPGLRQKLGGLDGSGQVIGDIDAYDEFTGRLQDHGVAVRDIATSEHHGVAPGATYQPFSPSKGGSLLSGFGNGPSGPDFQNLPDDPQKLREAVLTTGPGLSEKVTERVNQILDDPNRNPNMHVLNLSLGGTRMDYYNAVNQMTDKEHPEIRAAILGPNADQLSEKEVSQKIAAYTDGLLDDPESQYTQALQKWDATAKRANDADISLVVSAGNGGPGASEGTAIADQVHPGSLLNDLCRSPNVITVGAADVNGHPGLGNRDQQKLWNKSALGDGLGGTNPTLLAPGVDEFSDGTNTGSGTSFSAPYVAGTIALMKEANPNLTPAQIKELLTRSCTPLAGVDARGQGAGVLNPELAVQNARG